MKNKFVPAFLLLFTKGLFAQQTNALAVNYKPLSTSMRFVDSNSDNIVSVDEAKVVFDKYQEYSAKNPQSDLVEDVEKTIIELISYLEGVNCDGIKETEASKKFIDVYYANKFFDSKDESFGLLLENLKAKAKNTDEEPKVEAPLVNLDDDFEETIITDRPDQTEAPQLTPKGFFQIEVGTQSEFDNDKINKVSTQSTLYNTTLWKYGVTKNFELRLITEYANDKLKFKPNSDFGDTTITISGFNPIAVGAKIALQKEKGIIPEISLITHLELPYFGSSDFKPKYVVPRFRFLFAHTLTDRLVFSYNLGAEWEDGTNASTGIYTASLGASLFKNFSMFVEAYGFLKENETADNRLDGGFTYLINNDIQLDVSGGIGLSEISPDYFLSAGISFRFNAFNKAMRKQK